MIIRFVTINISKTGKDAEGGPAKWPPTCNGCERQARRYRRRTRTAPGSSPNGIPQGQLSGDRANMIAWLKVIGPIIYGGLYTRGAAAGVPAAPFYLNIALTAAALVLGPFALGASLKESAKAEAGAKQMKKA